MSWFSFQAKMFIFSTIVALVHGYAYYLTSTYCSRSLTVGTSIMGHKAVSSTSRSLQVYRGTTQLTSGDAYVSGETLQVSLSSTSGEYVFQVTTPASFVGGSCTNSVRVSNSAGTITMPAGGSGSISVWAGWATSESTVSISGNFILTDPGASVSTTAPSAQSTISPTLAAGQTYAPTISLSPTALPTIKVSSKPTESPTSTAVSSGSASSNGAASTTVVEGESVTMSVIGVGVLAIACFYFMNKSGILNKSDSKNSFLAIFASLLCGSAAVALVAQWARNSNTDTQFGYLGVPSMDSNPLAWHPILMVGGFFYGQIFAVCSWSFFSDRAIAKKVHVFFQTASVVTMIAGLCAIVKHMYEIKAEALTTLHAQVGVAAVAIFSLNYIWGTTMALLTMYWPDAWIRKALDFRAYHKFYGMVALGLIVLAIVTGVMDQLGNGACQYVLDSSIDTTSPSVYENPGKYYVDSPQACKVAHAMAFLVIIAAVLIVFVVNQRAARSREAPPASPSVPKMNESVRNNVMHNDVESKDEANVHSPEMFEVYPHDIKIENVNPESDKSNPRRAEKGKGRKKRASMPN